VTSWDVASRPHSVNAATTSSPASRRAPARQALRSSAVRLNQTVAVPHQPPQEAAVNVASHNPGCAMAIEIATTALTNRARVPHLTARPAILDATIPDVCHVFGRVTARTTAETTRTRGDSIALRCLTLAAAISTNVEGAWMFA
jgi:hypothetical protein